MGEDVAVVFGEVDVWVEDFFVEGVVDETFVPEVFGGDVVTERRIELFAGYEVDLEFVYHGEGQFL